ncbi:MAG: hypothetical protein H6718_07785 [Polyangiaceae bacterium]|nr:hypothetical protein [Polyangiaceae bacterium]MCB9606701.1 hypothetical protein [Polyangiaceae bacterium]
MKRAKLCALGLAMISVVAVACDSGSSSSGVDASGGAGGAITDASTEADAPDYGDAMPLPDATIDADAEALPDCGPGCRIALKRPVRHAAWGHGFSTTWVADTNQYEVSYAQVGSDETFTVPQESAFARVNGDHISYIGFDAWPQGEIAVIDATNKTRQVYYSFPDSRDHGFTGTFITDKNVLWTTSAGLFKADLKSKAVSHLSNDRLDCREGCTAEGAIYCVNTNTGRVDRIDEETGELTHIDDGGALQVEGACSPDRKKIVWVDHRGAGQASSYDGFRGEAEIYLHDIPSGTTKRVTSDSPDNGIAKTFAAVGTDWVVWHEPCGTCAKTFGQAGELYYAATRLVRMDLNTNQRCHLDDFHVGDYSSLHGHHLYGYWNDGKNKYLVDVDLDDPALNWVCE